MSLWMPAWITRWATLRFLPHRVETTLLLLVKTNSSQNRNNTSGTNSLYMMYRDPKPCWVNTRQLTSREGSKIVSRTYTEAISRQRHMVLGALGQPKILIIIPLCYQHVSLVRTLRVNKMPKLTMLAIDFILIRNLRLRYRSANQGLQYKITFPGMPLLLKMPLSMVQKVPSTRSQWQQQRSHSITKLTSGLKRALVAWFQQTV